MKIVRISFVLLSLASILTSAVPAQSQPPMPGPPKAVSIPAVAEKNLANGLNVSVVRRTASPIVTVRLVIKKGANNEPASKAGLADLTAAMLTKGTKTRTATQIAESVEFLGGSIFSPAGWLGTSVGVTVTSDKLPQAMAILADVVLNPKFAKEELDLIKTQTLDGLTYDLKQPTSLANYVVSKYSFGEHPATGTKASVEAITEKEISDFYKANYSPDSAVLVFSGDIDQQTAYAMANRYFSRWKRSPNGTKNEAISERPKGQTPLFRRILVIDLPKSGQAAVTYAKPMSPISRKDPKFFTASVLNSILGGGYSSRLNSEIRIKRGLSYGAFSSFVWRNSSVNFSAQVQTKNESAPEVASLILTELKRMVETSVTEEELIPRKAALTGGFSRNLENGGGLAAALGDLYVFGLPTTALNSYVGDINAVTSQRVKDFASEYLYGGDVIIVGDYSLFREDLAKRFPGTTFDVINADDIDLSKDNLRK